MDIFFFIINYQKITSGDNYDSLLILTVVSLFSTFEKHKVRTQKYSIMITKATIEDISSLNTLINSAYRGESSKKGWTTEASLLKGLRTTEEELTTILQNPNNIILKFTENSRIIACVLLVEKEQQLYLGMLTVSPELQNSGLGKQLLQQAEIHALAVGLPKIVMTVISVREELIAWYKRHGYNDTGEREAFPASDVHIPISPQPLEFIVLEKNIV